MIINIDGTHNKNKDASEKGLQEIAGGEFQYIPLTYAPSTGGFHALIMLGNIEGLTAGLKHNIVASMLGGAHIVGNVAIVAPQETSEGFSWRVLNKNEYDNIAKSITRILKTIKKER